ncbi:related to inner kinetochore protein MIF2 [Ustilago trichophora]|uniref:CENP-C homolog n=1 Tax=Ustilago trichophora TaxID=86804 RepID=A0A5C3DSH3_9BASI|nr:related to inner kinetochore protein MIF2 [Ustilago trichophora]
MAPQASRRFHEAGVGSRTGLRLSAVARDQDGFEDLEAFYKASQAALDHGQQTIADEEEDDDEDDYDSFDETPFSRRSGTGVNGKGRQAASSSSMMDIQNSSAPSPRSLLRSSRPSTISTSSSARKGKANITLADDDDEDDLDLPNLSTGSRSFDLGAMGADDNEDYDELPRAPPTLSAPAKGLSARQTTPKGKGKGKAASTGRRVDLSDSEDDDGILAHLQQRLNSAYDDDQDMDAQSDYDVVPVRASPAKAKANAPAPKPRSLAKPAAKKQAAPVEGDPLPASTASRPKPSVSASQSAQSPKRKTGRPPKSRAAEPEPEPEPTYEDDYDEPEPAHLPPPSPSPAPEPAQPPKRKRGRPPKNRAAEEPTYDESRVAPSSRPAQKSKASADGTSRPAASSSKPKASSASKTKRTAGEVVEKVRPPPREATVFDENGVRRSTRQRFAPLEYWRGERIRYGRPSLPTGSTVEDLRRRPGEDEFEDDPSMMLMRKRVPVLDIKEVIRVPRAPGEGTFAGTTRPRTTTSRRKIDRKSEDRTPRPPSRTPDPERPWEVQLDPTADTVHPEDGWDVKTVETGLVIDDEDQIEILTSIVRTKSSLQPLVAANQQFRFEKLFNCGGLMATGILQLPPGTRKPTKPSKDNSFVFCVLQGALRATVHRKSFIVGPEGVFQVPSGNTYSLENICERDVKLFFAQCRKTKKVSEGDITTFTQMSDTSYGTPQQMMMGVGRFGGTAGGSANVEREREAEESEDEEEEQESEAEQAVGKKPRLDAVTHAKASKQIPARTATVPTLTADSDQEESEEDDFETSRQMKSKKRVFRKV